MRLHRAEDSNDEIDADFEISLGDGPLFTLTVESSGGATGSGNVRNPDYPLLIEEVLRRLSSLDVYLMDAFVDSRRVAHLPEAERRINVDGRPFPIRRAPDEDFTALRRGITRPQGDIGSSRSVGGGNQRKRATLVFKASTPKTRSDLIESLHAREPRGRDRRSGIAAGLSTAHLEAAIADWRRMGREDFLAKYQAPAARRYVVVDGDDEMDAMALILGARAVAGLAIEGTWRGDRENIATPLRRLGFAVEDLERPSEGPLGPDPQTYVGLAERLGAPMSRSNGWEGGSSDICAGRWASPPATRTPSLPAKCADARSHMRSWLQRTSSPGTCAPTRNDSTCLTSGGRSASPAATRCSNRVTSGWTTWDE